MQQHILKILITIVIFILKISINNSSKPPPPPWFMHGEYLYYINTEQEFTSNYTQKECIKQKMVYSITQANAVELLPHLKRVYGDFPALWTYNNEIFNKILNTHIKMRSCFQLSATSEKFKPHNCSEKSGFICSTQMKSAALFYENSVVRVFKNDIKQFCDPHANISNANDVLYSCMIYL